jgi:outer membrane receptor protein involved in Fe transport
LSEGSARSRLLSNTEIQVGVRNIFNTKPPYDAAGVSGAYYSSLGDARLASYYVSVKRTF